MIQRLTPRFVEKSEWGSTQLEPWFPNSDRKIGEVWFEGVGDAPLLIKFLFTTAALSVQVHPDDAYAAEHHVVPGKAARGKTEMWHILRAEPGAQIAAGFKNSCTMQQLHDASISGEVEQMLAWHDARPGDTFFIPAGTVHAIGAGLVLCEIQQTSDITYRLYDYGRPRELHLEHGVRVSDLNPHAARQSATEGVLVQCPYFTTERRVIAGQDVLGAPGKDSSVIILEGAGELGSLNVRAGEVFHISADAGATNVSGHMTLLRTFA